MHADPKPGQVLDDIASIPAAWRERLLPEIEATSFRDLLAFVEAERARATIYPPRGSVFRALALTPPSAVKVVLLGQDPYHGEGQAHGLCFSVERPTKPPPSLKNVFRELETDLGLRAPGHGDLTPWAQRGVLLLNTILTVVAHEAGSHQGRGWEQFTDAIIASVDAQPTPVVFCLWGAHARKKVKLVDTTKHAVVEGAHPSPLSAKKFLGSRPFSAINRELDRLGREPIDWSL